MSKHIVYKTINLVNKKEYIGVHKTENPEVFDGYLGNGIYINKPSSYEKGKTSLQLAVKKYGPSNFLRTTIAIFDNAEEAYLLEANLVNQDYLKRHDVYNMVLGGEMQEYKTIKVFQYSLNGEFLNEYESIKQAAFAVDCCQHSISNAIIRKQKIKGFFWATDRLKKLDLNLYNTNIQDIKSVFVFDTTGKLINEFDNANQASKSLNVSSASIIRSCVLGYIVNAMYYFSYVKAEKYDLARSEYIKTRKVFKYNSSGEFICEYKMQSQAEKENPNVNINKSIKNKSADINGNYWGVVKLNLYNVPKNNVRKVGMYHNNVLLKTWSSGNQCIKELGKGVQHCLRGESKFHKGYEFKYIN